MNKKLAVSLLVGVFVVSGILLSQTNVAGNWKITVQSPRGERVNDMTITQEKEKLQVTIKSERGDQTYEGTVTGNEITWSGKRQSPQGDEITITYKGTVEGDTMKGSADMGGRFTMEWKAERVK